MAHVGPNRDIGDLAAATITKSSRPKRRCRLWDPGGADCTYLGNGCGRGASSVEVTGQGDTASVITEWPGPMGISLVSGSRPEWECLNGQLGWQQ
jgi:hypothetical protein